MIEEQQGQARWPIETVDCKVNLQHPLCCPGRSWTDTWLTTQEHGETGVRGGQGHRAKGRRFQRKAEGQL